MQLISIKKIVIVKTIVIQKGNDLENEYINIDNKELLVNGIVENTSGDAEMFMAGYRWYSPSKAPSYLKRARYGSYSLSWHCYSLKLPDIIRKYSIWYVYWCSWRS